MIEVKLESIYDIDQILEVMAWCKETFGFSKYDELGRWIGGCWCLERNRSWIFKFANSADATAFALRWA